MSVCLSVSLSLSLSLTHTYTHTHSLSLSLSHTLFDFLSLISNSCTPSNSDERFTDGQLSRTTFLNSRVCVPFEKHRKLFNDNGFQGTVGDCSGRREFLRLRGPFIHDERERQSIPEPTDGMSKNDWSCCDGGGNFKAARNKSTDVQEESTAREQWSDPWPSVIIARSLAHFAQRNFAFCQIFSHLDVVQESCEERSL